MAKGIVNMPWHSNNFTCQIQLTSNFEYFHSACASFLMSSVALEDWSQVQELKNSNDITGVILGW